MTVWFSVITPPDIYKGSKQQQTVCDKIKRNSLLSEINISNTFSMLVHDIEAALFLTLKEIVCDIVECNFYTQIIVRV